MSRERPRVALVAHDVIGQQGSGRWASELIRRGHDEIDFVVVSRTIAEDLRPLVEWKRAPAPDRPFRFKFAAFFLTAAAQILRARADLVHLHVTGPIVPNRADIISSYFCRAGFYELAGTLGAKNRPLRWRISTAVHVGLERWSNRRARVMIAFSEGSKHELERFFPGVQVRVIPNGVDTEQFRPDPATREEFRSAEGVEPDEVVALIVANAWLQKGLPVAIEALKEAPRLLLWVVGYGDQERYANLAQSHGVEERVRFFGLRRDVGRFYQAADIFVLPTMYEQASLAADEAAASGLPIVAPRVHGMSELVGDDAAGRLVEREPHAVGRALAELAADTELRARLGAEGRRRCLERTWERSVDEVLALYRELLGSRL